MYDVDNSGSINVIEMAAIIRYFIHFKGFSLNALIINIVIHLYYDSFKAYRGKLQWGADAFNSLFILDVAT